MTPKEIQDLKVLLERLRQEDSTFRVFGANRHQYNLGPTLTEQERLLGEINMSRGIVRWPAERRLVFIFALMLPYMLLPIVSYGETHYLGLQPGKSTKDDVKKVLGQPVRQVSETVAEYKPQEGAGKIQVLYRKPSAETTDELSAVPPETDEAREVRTLAEVFVKAMRDKNLDAALACVHADDHEAIRNEVAEGGFPPLPADIGFEITINGETAGVRLIGRSAGTDAVLGTSKETQLGFDMVKKDGRWWVTR